MFLEVLRRRNPDFLKQTIALHQAGKLPANCYVIDLDTLEENTRIIAAEALRLGLKAYAMTKQLGRNGACCEAIVRGGISQAVAVDMECARGIRRGGMRLGHVGHLVQVPVHETRAAAAMHPDFWTVFSLDKATEAARASAIIQRTQPLLARIFADGDTFYRGHEGGFPADTIESVVSQLDALDGARFAGITSFPALLFDHAQRRVVATPNSATLCRARDALEARGRRGIEINMPGTTSSTLLPLLAKSGATQVEPGHGLTGTTPPHAFEDLPERPAVLYLSEVSHRHGGSVYCFGGGLYVDPVFPDYKITAIVSRDSALDTVAEVELPKRTSIDYYGMIDAREAPQAQTGDSVLFGFRPQAFVTRAYTAGVRGIRRDHPEVEGISDSFGRSVAWPD
jgi:predicted amino acid racemase